MENRRYDIDWLRSLTVLSIILFHSCIIFMQYDWAVFYVKSNITLGICVVIESILSRFHMVLLFLLAGMSVFYSLKKRSIRTFIRTRIKKIFIPFILCNILLNPLTSYIYSLSKGRDVDLLKHIYCFFTSVSENFEGLTLGYTPMHTWFLLYLFVFSMVGIPLFRWGKTEAARKIFDRLAAFFTKPFAMLLLAVPYPIIFLIHLLGDKNPIAYAYVFFVGYMMATHKGYQEALDRDRKGYLLLTIVMTLLGYSDVLSGMTMIRDTNILLLKIVLCFTIMGYAHTYIPNKKTKVLSYISKANFSIYIYHMFILALVGYIILKVPMNPYLQWLLINIVSYTICFAIYDGFSRIKRSISDQRNAKCTF